MNLLSNVTPRFYKDIKESVDSEYPEFSQQLDGLAIVDRCQCGEEWSVNLVLNQIIKEFVTKESAFFAETNQKHISVMSGINEQGRLIDFEIGDDYEDGYINSCLEGVNLYGTNLKGDC